MLRLVLLPMLLLLRLLALTLSPHAGGRTVAPAAICVLL
jgi:hypothetical protein